MDFLDTMCLIERRFSDGDPLEALILALELRRQLLEDGADAEHLGWLRYTRLRCLHALELDEEGLALLDSVEPTPWALSPRNEAWMYEVGAELAWRQDRPAKLVEHALHAVERRLEDRDVRGAEQVCERALTWLEALGAPELAEALIARVEDAWTRPPLGSPEALAGATLAARVYPRTLSLPGGPQRRWELALWQAAARGDRRRVRALVMMGVDPSARVAGSVELPTPLIVAACRGHIDVVEQLLELGVPTDSVNVHGRAALHVAADAGHRGVVRRLLAAEARTDLADVHGRTPLHLALWRKHRRVARDLVQAGALLSVIDAQGRTPEGLAAAV